MRLLEATYHKLRPGSKIILDSEKLKSVRLAGLSESSTALPAPGPIELASLTDLCDVFNANVERLNQLFFTHLDYAAIGQRL